MQQGLQGILLMCMVALLMSVLLVRKRLFGKSRQTVPAPGVRVSSHRSRMQLIYLLGMGCLWILLAWALPWLMHLRTVKETPWVVVLGTVLPVGLGIWLLFERSRSQR